MKKTIGIISLFLTLCVLLSSCSGGKASVRTIRKLRAKDGYSYMLWDGSLGAAIIEEDRMTAYRLNRDDGYNSVRETTEADFSFEVIDKEAFRIDDGVTSRTFRLHTAADKGDYVIFIDTSDPEDADEAMAFMSVTIKKNIADYFASGGTDAFWEAPGNSDLENLAAMLEAFRNPAPDNISPEETKDDAQQDTTGAAPTTEPEIQTVVLTDPPTTAYVPPTTAYIPPTPAQTGYQIGYNTPSHAGVILRTGPGQSYEKIGTLTEGAAITPTGETYGGYSRIRTIDGILGWVMTQYITGGAAPVQPGGTAYRVSYNTPDHAGLVLRDGPGHSYAKLGTLTEGTVIYLLGEANDLYTKIRTETGTVGWILKKYVVSY